MVAHIALTRVWVTAMINGVPVGAQIAWLLCTTSGSPLDVTRVVPVIHCPLTHGPLAMGCDGSEQPTTTYGVLSSTVD
jgi:hypothetical protein